MSEDVSKTQTSLLPEPDLDDVARQLELEPFTEDIRNELRVAARRLYLSSKSLWFLRS